MTTNISINLQIKLIRHPNYVLLSATPSNFYHHIKESRARMIRLDKQTHLEAKV
jgi:hypothetical protein